MHQFRAGTGLGTEEEPHLARRVQDRRASQRGSVHGTTEVRFVVGIAASVPRKRRIGAQRARSSPSTGERLGCYDSIGSAIMLYPVYDRLEQVLLRC